MVSMTKRGSRDRGIREIVHVFQANLVYSCQKQCFSYRQFILRLSISVRVIKNKKLVIKVLDRIIYS